MTYNLSRTREILIVTLTGGLTRPDARAMAELIHEVEVADVRAVVLNLDEVSDIDSAQVPHFAKLQAAVRRKEAKLRICSLKPSIESFLHELGVVRHEEVQPDLKSALLSIVM